MTKAIMDPGVIDSSISSKSQKNLEVPKKLPKVPKFPKETNLYTYISKFLLELPHFHVYTYTYICRYVYTWNIYYTYFLFL